MIKDNVIFKKILVVVDGSNPSLDAANQAIKLAKKHKAELTALYVVSPDVRYDYLQDGLTPGLPGPLKEILIMAMEGGQKHVDEVKQKASKTKIIVQTDVVLGSTSVAKAILDYAEQHNVDLIVIGTR